MTWAEVKAAFEEAGVEDDDQIDYIDIHDLSCTNFEREWKQDCGAYARYLEWRVWS
jgi:hypothetical protein